MSGQATFSVAEDDDLSEALYKVSERVLCLQGPKLYEAKIRDIRREHDDKKISYLVHYHGWDSKRWDEWVDESLVLRWTDNNLKMREGIDVATDKENKKSKKEFKAKVKAGAAKRKQSTSIKRKLQDENSHSDSESSTQRHSATGRKSQVGISKRRKMNESVETEKVFKAKQEINVSLPIKLKQALFDDWNYIYCHQMVTDIPTEHTVDSILNDYLKYAGEISGDDEKGSSAKDLCIGIKEYFNTMLILQLLYGIYETDQLKAYLVHCKEENQEIPEMSSIYGANHLLRLFTKLGHCLAYTALEPEEVDLLLTHVDDFLNFLVNNFAVYFDAPSSVGDLDDSGVPSSPDGPDSPQEGRDVVKDKVMDTRTIPAEVTGNISMETGNVPMEVAVDTSCIQK